MNILGLNFGHDGSAAVIKDGRLAAAVSLERITRVKKAAGVTQSLVEYVLDSAGLSLEHINAIALAAYVHTPDTYVKLFTSDGREIKQHLLDLFGGQTHVQLVARIGDRSLPA